MAHGPALVTGGAGFIGSNLVDALLAEGRDCHVIDDLSNGRRINVADAAVFHQVDIRDGAAVAAVAERVRPASIFHLAAQADVRRSVDEPAFDAAVNVIGTIGVLEAARAVGASVVFASTGGAGYGEYEGLPVPSPETAPTRPLSPYGQSKMAAEGYCATYSRLFDLRAVVLRLGNVYGPRQDPHGEAGVVAIFCGKLLDGEPPKVFGDGRQTRDYAYVGDVVRAFLAADERMPAGETINVGCGREVTVLDLIEGLGYEGAPEMAAARPGELQRSALAVERARELLGWTAQVSLAEGLRITHESVRSARLNPDQRAPGAFEPMFLSS